MDSDSDEDEKLFKYSKKKKNSPTPTVSSDDDTDGDEKSVVSNHDLMEDLPANNDQDPNQLPYHDNQAMYYNVCIAECKNIIMTLDEMLKSHNAKGKRERIEMNFGMLISPLANMSRYVRKQFVLAKQGADMRKQAMEERKRKEFMEQKQKAEIDVKTQMQLSLVQGSSEYNRSVTNTLLKRGVDIVNGEKSQEAAKERAMSKYDAEAAKENARKMKEKYYKKN